MGPAADRRLTGGQEDIIIDVALTNLARRDR
ncbi:MAG: hypothetical protein JO147_12285 [Actinobacteria bacterium]|nr:hypothetical protein [Actinomycetota bacterium]